MTRDRGHHGPDPRVAGVLLTERRDEPVTPTAQRHIRRGQRVWGGSDYSLDGTAHIGTTVTGEITKSKSTTYGKVLKSNFKYARYHKPGTAYPLDCLAADDDYAMAYQWAGGWTESTDVTSLDNHCTKGSRSGRAAAE